MYKCRKRIKMIALNQINNINTNQNQIHEWLNIGLSAKKYATLYVKTAAPIEINSN